MSSQLIMRKFDLSSVVNYLSSVAHLIIETLSNVTKLINFSEIHFIMLSLTYIIFLATIYIFIDTNKGLNKGCWPQIMKNHEFFYLFFKKLLCYSLNFRFHLYSGIVYLERKISNTDRPLDTN